MDIFPRKMHKIRHFGKNITGDFMRKYTIFALICLCTLLILFTFYYNDKNKSNQNNNTPNENEYVYTLISEDGTVNLYKGTEFVKNYSNIIVTDLPLTDRDNLISGIKLKTMDEVMRIIEDFDGNG